MRLNVRYVVELYLGPWNAKRSRSIEADWRPIAGFEVLGYALTFVNDRPLLTYRVIDTVTDLPAQREPHTIKKGLG